MVLLLNEYQTQVEFVKVSPLHEEDLIKALINVADTVIVSTDYNRSDDDAFDILTVVSIKNANANVRVIIQTVTGRTAVRIVLLLKYAAIL